MRSKVIIFGFVLLGSLAHSNRASATFQRRETKTKRSYDCPANFLQLGKKCYFFSQEQLPWQEAYFKCETLKSQMVIIKNERQDTLIRKALNQIESREYWIGGRYNWHKKQWNWARSSKPLIYNGFDPLINYKDHETLKWSCITLDPEFFYRWSSISCLVPKHFICQKKIRSYRPKQRINKAFYSNSKRGYNDIPIPETSKTNILDPYKNDKSQQPKSLYQVDLKNDLGNDLKNYRLKRKNNRRNRTHRTQSARPTHSQISHVGQYSNGTLYEEPKSFQAQLENVQQSQKDIPEHSHVLLQHSQTLTSTEQSESPKAQPLHAEAPQEVLERSRSLDSQKLSAYQLYKKISRKRTM